MRRRGWIGAVTASAAATVATASLLATPMARSGLAVASAPSVPSSASGTLDVADASGGAGWAYDPAAGSSPVTVQVFVDGVLAASVVANLSRPDIVAGGAAPDPDHGFVFALSGLAPGVHTVDAYAVGLGGAASTRLNGSGRSITVASPAAPPPPAPTAPPSPPPAPAPAPGLAPAPKPIDIPYTLACIYMPKPHLIAGQWSDLRVSNLNRTIRAQGGQRLPILGYYDGASPDVLDWQIKLAVDRGITCFFFDDYWTASQDTPLCEQSLSAFLASRYGSLMQFAPLLFENTTPQGDGASKRSRFLATIMPYYARRYLARQNYLLVNGRPYIGIGSLSEVFGDSSAAEIAATLQAADAYLAGNTPFAGAYWATADLGTTSLDFSQARACGFAAVAPYYVLPWLFPPTPQDQWPIQITPAGPDIAWPAGVPYATIRTQSAALHRQGFAEAAAQGLQFVTSVAPDFDSRRLTWVPNHVYFEGQNPTDYWNLLSEVKTIVGGAGGAVPVVTNTGKPLVGLGPWNEHIECSSVEPSLTAFGDRFFVATAAAKIFGGPQSYDEPSPGDRSVAAQPSTWSFDAASGAVASTWGDIQVASSLLPGPTSSTLTLDGTTCSLATGTDLTASGLGSLTVHVAPDTPDAIARVLVRLITTTYPDGADRPGAPDAAGSVGDSLLARDGADFAATADGARDYTFDLSALRGSAGRLGALELRIERAPGPSPHRVELLRVAFGP